MRRGVEQTGRSTGSGPGSPSGSGPAYGVSALTAIGYLGSFPAAFQASGCCSQLWAMMMMNPVMVQMMWVSRNTPAADSSPCSQGMPGIGGGGGHGDGPLPGLVTHQAPFHTLDQDGAEHTAEEASGLKAPSNTALKKKGTESTLATISRMVVATYTTAITGTMALVIFVTFRMPRRTGWRCRSGPLQPFHSRRRISWGFPPRPAWSRWLQWRRLR